MIIYAQRQSPLTGQAITLAFQSLQSALYFFGIYFDYDSIQKRLRRNRYCHIKTGDVDMPIGFAGTWVLTPEEE